MAEALPLSLATIFQGAVSFSSSTLFSLFQSCIPLGNDSVQPRPNVEDNLPSHLLRPTFRKVFIPIGRNFLLSIQTFWYIYWYNILISYTTLPHPASTVIYQAYLHTYYGCSYLWSLFQLLVALGFNIYEYNCLLIYLSSIGLRVGGLCYRSYIIWLNMFALLSRAAHATCTSSPKTDPLATLTSVYLFIFIKTSPRVYIIPFIHTPLSFCFPRYPGILTVLCLCSVFPKQLCLVIVSYYIFIKIYRFCITRTYIPIYTYWV